MEQLNLFDAQIQQFASIVDRILALHSLGSVVAYEALCRKPENVVSFVSFAELHSGAHLRPRGLLI